MDLKTSEAQQAWNIDIYQSVRLGDFVESMADCNGNLGNVNHVFRFYLKFPSHPSENIHSQTWSRRKDLRYIVRWCHCTTLEQQFTLEAIQFNQTY